VCQGGKGERETVSCVSGRKGEGGREGGRDSKLSCVSGRKGGGGGVVCLLYQENLNVEL